MLEVKNYFHMCRLGYDQDYSTAQISPKGLEKTEMPGKEIKYSSPECRIFFSCESESEWL